MTTKKKTTKVYRLTPQQKKFCRAYAIDGNAKQSMISAGYSEQYADTQSQALLGKHKVQEYLQELSDGAERISHISIADIDKEVINTLKDKKETGSTRMRAAELLYKRKGAFKSDDQKDEEIDLISKFLDDQSNRRKPNPQEG